MALSRSQLTLPQLPQETVTVEALGGEIILRGMLLSEHLDLVQRREEIGYRRLSYTLAACAVDEEGKPLMTVDEWERFGAMHSEQAFTLFGIANRLSGLSPPEEKKSARSGDESRPSSGAEIGQNAAGIERVDLGSGVAPMESVLQ